MFTYYVNKFYEVDDGAATSYFFRDDERIAKQTTDGTQCTSPITSAVPHR